MFFLVVFLIIFLTVYVWIAAKYHSFGKMCAHEWKMMISVDISA